MSTRRQFLGTAAALAGAGYTAWPRLAAAQGPVTEEWRNRQSDMAYRRLGRTGFMVSEVVMGGNELRPGNVDHVLSALDRGLNYLDTSPAYGDGQGELALAEVIKRPRDQFFLNSKVSVFDENRNQQFQEIFARLDAAEQANLRAQARERIEQRQADHPDYLVNYFGPQRAELENAVLSNVMETKYGQRIDRAKHYKQLIIDSVNGSLRRLRTDHLDLLMCPHGASSSEELTAFPEILEAFETLRAQGKARYLGVSSHSDPAGVLTAAAESAHYAVAMVAYNIVNQSFMNDALARAAERGLGVIAMKVARPVFGGPGRETPRPDAATELNRVVAGDWSVPQKAYLWGLRNRSLSAVIANMVNQDQVTGNLVLPLAAR